MRLVPGPATDSKEFTRDAAWRPLREPDAGLAQVLALPIAVCAGTAVVVLWAILTPFSDPGMTLRSLATTLVVLVPLHELTHAAAFPGSLASSRLVIVVWPWRVQYDGEVSKARYLWILSMPLLVISVAPAILCAMLGKASPAIALISLVNALASSGDVLAGILVLAQIPPDAVIRTHGSMTLWQPRPVQAAATLDHA